MCGGAVAVGRARWSELGCGMALGCQRSSFAAWVRFSPAPRGILPGAPAQRAPLGAEPGSLVRGRVPCQQCGRVSPAWCFPRSSPCRLAPGPRARNAQRVLPGCPLWAVVMLRCGGGVSVPVGCAAPRRLLDSVPSQIFSQGTICTQLSLKRRCVIS